MDRDVGYRLSQGGATQLVVPHVQRRFASTSRKPLLYVWRHWFSWRYDAKYKEVRINIDNNDKNTGSKSRKKEPKDKR
jgi:hypothetical protein